jgi:hypothetical protein
MGKLIDRVRRGYALWPLFALCAALASCGGGGDDSPSANSVAPPPAGPLQISGTPLATWLQGLRYSFRPTATDSAGNAITFSGTNVPSWAALNPSNGELSGTPTSAQVGVYADIVISASAGGVTASLPAFSISVVATASGSATLSWTPPTSHGDGTALTDLASYKVYRGVAPGDYLDEVQISDSGLTRYVVDQLTPAKWYFAVSAIDSLGRESKLSNEASKIVQ